MVAEPGSTYPVVVDQRLVKGGVFPRECEIPARDRSILEKLRQEEDFVLLDDVDHVFESRTIAPSASSLVPVRLGNERTGWRGETCVEENLVKLWLFAQIPYGIAYIIV